MHFVGIKCEVCGNIANCKDEIDDLPWGWHALVEREQFWIKVTHKALHFCSMKCLCSWAREQTVPASEAG